MSSNVLRREVLKSFKKLHRTSQVVFKNDKKVSETVRKEINDHYRKNKDVSDVESIKDLIKFAGEVNYEIKTSVIELEETVPGTFRVHIRPDMWEEMDNPPKKITE